MGLAMKKTLHLIKPDLVLHPRQPLGENTPWMPEIGLDGLEALLNSHGQSRHEDSAWMKMLQYSEVQLLHLVRAFIMNPEVMVMQHPLRGFNAKMSKSVINALVKLVREK